LKKKLCYWPVAVEDRVLFGVSLADRKLLMKMMKTETKKSPALRRFFLSPFTFKLKEAFLLLLGLFVLNP
jgi:hypothetical protein